MTEEQLHEAFLQVEIAAKTGLPEAQTYCGIMLMCGTGCHADPEKAAEWFKLAADQEEREANYRLGVMSLLGIGVKRDKQAAREYFRVAAERCKDPRAMFELGRLSLKEKDYSKAYQNFCEAADRQYVKATLVLAEMFEKGLGKPKDKNLGMMLRSYAKEQEAVDLLQELVQKPKSQKLKFKYKEPELLKLAQEKKR